MGHCAAPDPDEDEMEGTLDVWFAVDGCEMGHFASERVFVVVVDGGIASAQNQPMLRLVRV